MGADEWVTDPASLTLNGMMEIGKLDWSDRILQLCGIDRDRVPPVGIPSGQAGTLSATAAAETGLPEASRSAGARATSSARRSGPAWCVRGRPSSPSARASWSPTSTAWTGSRAATCGGAATPCPARGTSRAARSRSAPR